jgi:tetratricopeptide (TPR) repeat protein
MLKSARLFKPLAVKARAETLPRVVAAWLVLGLALVTADALGQVSPDTTARRLLQEGRYDEALTAIEAELRRRPADGQMLLLKGAALSMAQRKDEAIKVLRLMVQKKLEEASAYNNLAVIYAGQGDFESARSALEWAVRGKPDYVTAHHNLGNVYANLASQSYRRALQLDKADRSLPAKLAQLDEVLGQPPGTGGAPEGRRAEPSAEPPRKAAASSVAMDSPSKTAAAGGLDWGGNGN